MYSEQEWQHYMIMQLIGIRRAVYVLLRGPDRAQLPGTPLVRERSHDRGGSRLCRGRYLLYQRAQSAAYPGEGL